jgi:hypothetical protein
MSTALAALALVAVAVVVVVVVQLARRGTLPPSILLALAGACAAGLAAMLVTDWPAESLAPFWREHSVVSATTSTLLLVGIGFLAFEAVDQQRQRRVDDAVTSAGMGGVVDHLVDVDDVLSLIQCPKPPAEEMWPGWDAAARPLKWLREHRGRLARTSDGDAAGDDPRARPVPWALPAVEDDWRQALADQAVRRVMVAMRDWGPLIGRSRDGLRLLVRLGEIRNQLLDLTQALDRRDMAGGVTKLQALRRDCADLALDLELASGAYPPRAEVLTGAMRLGPDSAWIADRTKRQDVARRRVSKQ